jgi:hypothetical protein
MRVSTAREPGSSAVAGIRPGKSLSTWPRASGSGPVCLKTGWWAGNPAQCHLLFPLPHTRKKCGADLLVRGRRSRRPVATVKWLIPQAKSGSGGTGPRGHPDQGVRPTIYAVLRVLRKVSGIGQSCPRRRFPARPSRLEHRLAAKIGCPTSNLSSMAQPHDRNATIMVYPRCARNSTTRDPWHSFAAHSS